MRRILVFVLTILLLCGCSKSDEQIEQALHLRDSILKSNGCSFTVTVIADYQDVYYTFEMSCNSDSIGNISFEVTAPETISGITGIITAGDGRLTFDNQLLVFSTLADGQITPVSAPWLFLNTLKSGYIKGCANEDDGILLQIDDSYADGSMTQNIRIVNGTPSYVEMFYDGRRVVTMDVKEFRFL